MILAVMAFFALFNMYCLRVNLSVAIVDMVNSTAVPETQKHHDNSCAFLAGDSKKSSSVGKVLFDRPLNTAFIRVRTSTY
jgi:hypothetical protein